MQVNKREFYELYLGSTKFVEKRVRSTAQLNVDESFEILLIWEMNPAERFALPSLIVADEKEIDALLGAVASAPQAPSPITALSRVISREEAKSNFDSDVLPLNETVFPAVAALIFVESVIHANGKLGVKQLTPIICKRTLAYAWGRAMSTRSPAEAFLELPGRWLDVHGLLNSPQSAETARRTVDAVIGGLNLLAQLTLGIRPDSPGGALAFELLNGTKEAREVAWQRLGARLSRPVAIDTLQSLTREERGAYLQDALRSLTTIGSRMEYEEMAAACAFLATRLAPGSLEHLEVLRNAAQPELLAWYALYAALQNPKEILSLQGGLGFRLLRDLFRVEEKLAAPSADVAYSELKILARAGLEPLAFKIGHASELQVELIPYVATSFTFQLKNRARFGDAQLPLDAEMPGPSMSPRARAVQLAADLTRLAKELPDYSDEYLSAKKIRRRPG